MASVYAYASVFAFAFHFFYFIAIHKLNSLNVPPSLMLRFFPKQVYLWGSILEKNRLDTLVGALGLVGRGFGPAGRAGWVGRGVGHAGRAGWAGRGVGRGVWLCWARWLGWAWCWAWGLAVLGVLS